MDKITCQHIDESDTKAEFNLVIPYGGGILLLCLLCATDLEAIVLRRIARGRQNLSAELQKAALKPKKRLSFKGRSK